MENRVSLIRTNTFNTIFFDVIVLRCIVIHRQDCQVALRQEGTLLDNCEKVSNSFSDGKML